MVKPSLSDITQNTSIRRVVGLGLLALVSLIPIDGTALWQFAYGLTGQLSPSSWLLILIWSLTPLRFKVMFQGFCKFPTLFLVCIVMGLFYSLSLGNHGPDPYAWGYQPHELIILIGTSLLITLPYSKGLSLVVSLDLLAYAGHLLQSDNFWDYLFDPILFSFLLLLLMRGFIQEGLRFLRGLVIVRSD